MIFVGLFGFIRRGAVKGYLKELGETINTLSEIGTENVASILIYAVWLRAMLEIEGNLSILREDNGDISPELHSYPIMESEIQKWISLFKKRKYSAKSFAFLIWVHTLRSFYRPELSNQVKHMWDILMKTKPYWDKLLVKLRDEDIQLGISADIVLKTEKHAKAILRCLPPKQLS